MSACASCGEVDHLRTGGLLGQAICPHCTFANELAPGVLAALLQANMGSVVILDGSTVDLAAPIGATLLARKLSERHRRLGPAALFDWSGAVSFPEARSQGPVLS